MRINTNVSSLTAQEAAQNTGKSITGSLEKLSTGSRINKASDDASGLAIADKLRTQATSIKQGIDNGNSAVALLQIADKSMGEQSNILDTIKAKLIQANTSTTSEDGREAIRKDITKLLEQFDNIASQTNYNGTSLLQAAANDSSASSGLNFQIGEKATDIISNTSIQSNTNGLGGGNVKIVANENDLIGQGATTQLKGDGSAITLTAKDSATTPADAIEKVELSGNVGKLTATGGNLTISNVDSKTAELLKTIATNGTTPDLTANANGTFTLNSGKALDLTGVNVGKMQVVSDAAGTINITTEGIFNVKNLSDTAGDTLKISGNATGGELLSSLANLKEGDLTVDAAQKFQGVVDTAITGLNGYRGDIGSTQNQVESAVRNLMTQATNVKAAESIIRDVDYAAESANFNKQNIISQAGSYAISQANAVQQNVLRLLQ